MEQHSRQEREKARALRKSRWWQNRIANGTSCYYCQISLSPKEATMDHIIPISQGGRSTPGNVVPCCKTCNNLKKDSPAVDMLLDLLKSPQGV